MNRIRFSCFALLAAAAVACNKDDIIMREEAQAPVIAFDVNTGVYTAKVGREFTIARLMSTSTVRSMRGSWRRRAGSSRPNPC